MPSGINKMKGRSGNSPNNVRSERDVGPWRGIDTTPSVCCHQRRANANSSAPQTSGPIMRVAETSTPAVPAGRKRRCR